MTTPQGPGKNENSNPYSGQSNKPEDNETRSFGPGNATPYSQSHQGNDGAGAESPSQGVSHDQGTHTGFNPTHNVSNQGFGQQDSNQHYGQQYGQQPFADQPAYNNQPGYGNQQGFGQPYGQQGFDTNQAFGGAPAFGSQPQFDQPNMADGQDSFFGALFDLSFRRFATPSVVKVLYILIMIMMGLFALAGIIAGLAMMAADSSGIIGAIIIIPLFLLGALFGLAFYRVMLEMSVALIRTCQSVMSIDERQARHETTQGGNNSGFGV